MLEIFDKEVQAEADARTLEVLWLLMDRIRIEGNFSTEELLHKYVSLKLMRHKVKKILRDGFNHFYYGRVPFYESNWRGDEEAYQDLNQKFENLSFKCREARRKYYESKQRHGT